MNTYIKHTNCTHCVESDRHVLFTHTHTHNSRSVWDIACVPCVCVYVCGSIKRQITSVVKLNRFRLYSLSLVFTYSLALALFSSSHSHLFSFSLSVFISTHTTKFVALLLVAFSYSFSHSPYNIYMHARTQTINSSALPCFTLLRFCSFSF